MLSITEVETPILETSRLWLTKTAVEWFNVMQEIGGSQRSEHLQPSHPQPKRSLKDLFQDLFRNLCTPPYRTARLLIAASTLLGLEEAELDLERWYDLCMIHATAEPYCPITLSNLVIYYLISLNAITCFPKIERLTRKEAFSDRPSKRDSRRYRCIPEPKNAIIHCGQILRLISLMDKFVPPPWWAAAIYRAGIILWTDIILGTTAIHHEHSNGTILKINSVFVDDLSILEYLWNGNSVSVLVGINGEPVELRSYEGILRICMSQINDDFHRGFLIELVEH
ncbi:hypothetical protein EG329_002222 [Mollisiaceae sp. DMI_Dod_QoI]|nr:hypothetical protein EG329_002222 [Helotiales sp. DMI_Dod_QoI]